MTYKIKEAARLLNIPASTLRYYDKEGLLPFVQRQKSGYREFTEDDISMLRIIECLKKTGMSIKEIRQFTSWVQMGDASLKERYEMFLERRKIVEMQLEKLKETMDMIEFKCRYYKAALEAGTESIHKNSEKQENPSQN